MPHRTSRKMACREFKRFVQGCTADWQDHWDLSMEYLPLPVWSHSLSHSACGIKSGSLTCLWSLSSLRSFLLQIPNTSPLFQVNCLTTGSWNISPFSVPVAFLMSFLPGKNGCPLHSSLPVFRGWPQMVLFRATSSDSTKVPVFPVFPSPALYLYHS